jgi:hypothetical protein
VPVVREVTRWDVVRWAGAGWLGALPLAALLMLCAHGFAERVDVALAVWEACAAAVAGAVVGGAAVLVARWCAPRPARDVPPRLGHDHDDPAVTALRSRGSWLSAAGALVLVPLVVAFAAPSGPGGRGNRTPTPSSQTTGRFVLVVVVLVLALVVLYAALAAAERAERLASAALTEPGSTPSDDVRAVAAALRPVVLVRVGASAAVAGQLVTVGVLLTPEIGPAAPVVAVLGAIGLQGLAVVAAARN